MNALAHWWGALLRRLGTPRSAGDAHNPGTISRGGSSTAVPATPVFGARRPLINRAGALAGFEFRLPNSVANRLAPLPDSAASAAHVSALFASMRSTSGAERIAVIALPIALLSRPAILKAVPSGVMIAITDADKPVMQTARAHETLTALNQLGAKLGGVGQPLTGGEFVVINAERTSPATILDNVAAIRALWGEVKVIATGVANISDLEQLLRYGVDYAAGVVDRTAAVNERTPMSPRLQQICRLIHHVVSDEDFAGVSHVLQSEVELSYQLLRYVNSAGYGLTRPLESVDHAATVLGRDGLYQWLTLLLLNCGSGRATSKALREIALSRARLLEMLSGYTGAPPSGMFTLGLLSLLDVMLQSSMQEIIDQLPLAPPLRDALVNRSGDWHSALNLVQALEQGDLATAASLAWPYGGLEMVIEDSDEAWRWAAEASRTKH